MVTTTRAERPFRARCPKGLPPLFAERETGPHHLLQETLEQRRHIAQPERENQH